LGAGYSEGLTGERGEICVESDLGMSGYYKDITATAEVVRDGLSAPSFRRR
jgi:long-subunit acyl-CoA synthetase (AMP-forming)